MGLSDAEVKERVRKVASKVRKVTQSMVTCDTENRDKLKRRCKEAGLLQGGSKAALLARLGWRKEKAE